MTYLPNLIRRIDDFYHLISSAAPITPDYSYDPHKPQELETDERGDKLFRKIMADLDDERFENPTIASEVDAMANLYLFFTSNMEKVTHKQIEDALAQAKSSKKSIGLFANDPIDEAEKNQANKYISEIEENLVKINKLISEKSPQNTAEMDAQLQKVKEEIKEKQAVEEAATTMGAQENVF